MATIGLRDLYAALINTDEKGVDTYKSPFRLAKAIKADINVKVAEAVLYADDGVDEAEKEFSSFEIKLNVNKLSQEARQKLLGIKRDEKGVLISKATDSPVYVAIGARARVPGGEYFYIWYYRVKFAIPSESYETKGDNISFKTPEITGIGMKRHDDAWKADYVAAEDDDIAKTWFTKVYEQDGGLTLEEPEGEKEE